MLTKQQIRCPNCGSLAERYHSPRHEIFRTSCDSCDYLMISCAITGKVIEFYGPGITTPLACR